VNHQTVDAVVQMVGAAIWKVLVNQLNGILIQLSVIELIVARLDVIIRVQLILQQV